MYSESHYVNEKENLSNRVLSVGGDGEQLSRDSIEFQDPVCVLSSLPLTPLGKKK